MKDSKLLACLLCLAMLLTACVGASAEVYEGSSIGMQGTVTVAMTVEDGVIKNVELTECHETANIAGVAMERLPQLMVEHQTTTLDAVTGATLASNAIMRAAANAAKAAGLDADALKANAYSEPAGEDEVWDADVLVVGGGGAGLSAAISAAQGGAKVILVEKSSFLGGNTMMAGGAYNTVDPEAQKGVILTVAQKNTMDGYLALDHSDPSLKFDVFPEWEEVLTQLQQDITDFYAANEGKTAGVDMPGFDSVSLHMWHIYVGGLRQLLDGSWVASDITLARTLAENSLDTFKWLDSIGVYAANGADTTGLEIVQMMPSSSPVKGTMTDGIWGDASQQIWIDGEGNRFVNEYAERDVLTKASLALDGSIFYIIYAGSETNENGELLGASLDNTLFGTTVQNMVDNGHVWYGSTLAELAENSKKTAGGANPNFTEEALRATIEKYNSYVASQNDPDFGKEVLAGAIDIDAIEADPNRGFVISPRKASLHHTMGGVKIDSEAHVLNANGEAISGLWAAGEVTGGVHAGNRLGGNAEADIFTFGRIAGVNAAANQ